MKGRLLASLAAFALIALALQPAAAIAAGPTSSSSTAATSLRAHRLSVGRIDSKVLQEVLSGLKNVDVIVELSGKPVAVQETAARSAGRSFTNVDRNRVRAQVRASQGTLISKLHSFGGVVRGQLADAYNGVQARVPASSLAKIAAVPGVVAVHAVAHFRPSNAVGVPYIGGPQAWGDSGLTGDGVKIAVIDTGIDFYHADFGGTGDPADFAYGTANDTVVPALNHDGTVAFPNSKVVGGWDFVGDAYNADAPSTDVPVPDPNPLDCITGDGEGHGTHVSGTAAGYGVLSDGTTFHGPYNTTTESANSFAVAPGVAPDAQILFYRVFGCSGSTNVVAMAIDRAVADGADVINMSLGSAFGTDDEPDTVAANNAAAAGVVVVASAGNESNDAYVIGGPAAGSRVLSAAAIDASAPTYQGVAIGISPTSVVGVNNNGASLPVTGKLRVLQDSPGVISLGCAATDYAAVQPGDIVVTVRGVCARTDRATLGQAAGAGAAIMINNGDGYPPFEGKIPGVTIPFIGALPGDADALLAADGQTVTLASGPDVANPAYQYVASFSSGGPRSQDSAPKPDVTAPGVAVNSAAAGTGNDAKRLSGTSMAAPMTTGAAALVVEAHPGWSVDRIKAALMSTADATAAHILGYDVRIAGSGVIQVDKAATTVAVATTADHLDSLAFGDAQLNSAYRDTQSFKITNTSNRSITYDLTAAFNGDPLGGTVSVWPSTVRVPGHSSRTVWVTLRMSAAAAAALASDDTFAVGPGLVNSSQGVVVADPRGARAGVYNLRVPFVFVPRGLSQVVVGKPADVAFSSGMLSASAPLKNVGLHEGTADVYAWGLADKRDQTESNDVRAVGVESLPGAAAGVADTDRLLVFAVSNWTKSANPAENIVDISVDTGGTSAPEFEILGIDLGYLTAGDYNGIMASFVLDEAGNIIDAFYADAPMNGSIVELSALASDLGLADGASTFHYSVIDQSWRTGAVDDVPGVATFDSHAPAIQTGQFIDLPAGGTDTLPLAYDVNAIKTAPALGWLVVSVDDASGPASAAEVPLFSFHHDHGGPHRH